MLDINEAEVSGELRFADLGEVVAGDVLDLGCAERIEVVVRAEVVCLAVYVEREYACLCVPFPVACGSVNEANADLACVVLVGLDVLAADGECEAVGAVKSGDRNVSGFLCLLCGSEVFA